MQGVATDAIQIPVNIKNERHNLQAAELYEEAIRNGEALIGGTGPLVVSTGQYTGRSPKDKRFAVANSFFVKLRSLQIMSLVLYI